MYFGTFLIKESSHSCYMNVSLKLHKERIDYCDYSVCIHIYHLMEKWYTLKHYLRPNLDKQSTAIFNTWPLNISLCQGLLIFFS